MITFRVYGVPAPQGSKTRMPNGALVESASTTGRLKQKAWRTAVTETAREHIGNGPLEGPLFLSIEFRMPRPKSRKRAYYAATRPDSSKLVRCTEDALVDAGLCRDDALFCEHRVLKLYSDATDPWVGAVITVSELCEISSRDR